MLIFIRFCAHFCIFYWFLLGFWFFNNFKYFSQLCIIFEETQKTMFFIKFFFKMFFVFLLFFLRFWIFFMFLVGMHSVFGVGSNFHRFSLLFLPSTPTCSGLLNLQWSILVFSGQLQSTKALKPTTVDKKLSQPLPATAITNPWCWNWSWCWCCTTTASHSLPQQLPAIFMTNI